MRSVLEMIFINRLPPLHINGVEQNGDVLYPWGACRVQTRRKNFFSPISYSSAPVRNRLENRSKNQAILAIGKNGADKIR